MCLQTTKKERTAVHVQHDPLTTRIRLLPRPIIAFHLNPFTFQVSLLTAPLPPCLSTHALYASLTQLCIDVVCGFG
jgi:hypothetical protein